MKPIEYSNTITTYISKSKQHNVDVILIFTLKPVHTSCIIYSASYVCMIYPWST